MIRSKRENLLASYLEYFNLFLRKTAHQVKHKLLHYVQLGLLKFYSPQNKMSVNERTYRFPWAPKYRMD